MKIFLKYPAEILILVFLIITFLQSGIDKISDWQGNLSWLKDHFKDTPLKGMVPFMLSAVLITEVIAGVLCTIGVYQIIINQKPEIALYGAILSCITLLMLLFGQRVAKDYEGARTIVVYFIPAVILVFLLQA